MSNILMEYLTNIWYIGDWMEHRYDTYNKYAKDFENRLTHWYPFNDNNTFKISHGKKYFNFFRRLGEPFYYAMFDNNMMIGTICYIYRDVDSMKHFYICDLKFDKKARHTGLLMKLFLRTCPTCILRTHRFYGISMNDDAARLKGNNILSIGQHIGKKYGINVEHGGMLNIYSLDYETMKIIEDLVILYKSSKNNVRENKIKYVSLENVKDLIIKKPNGTMNKMKLLHMMYLDAVTECGKIMCRPIEGYQHMFCTKNNSILTDDLAKLNIFPMSTATIIQYDMDDFNWELIQTCDI
jgi:hypothetical protein